MSNPTVSRRTKPPAEQDIILIRVAGGWRIQEICRSPGTFHSSRRLSRVVFDSERSAQDALYRGLVAWSAWSKRR